VEGEYVTSQEDVDVHEWIRPFDCYVLEEGIVPEGVTVVEEVVVEEVDERENGDDSEKGYLPSVKQVFSLWKK